MTLHIISFGQSGYYFEIAMDLLMRFKIIYPHSKIHCYSEDDLNSEIQEYAKSYKRGFGYWRWKPIIIQKEVSKMSYGDVLLYVDGRAHLNTRTKSIGFIDKFLISDNDFALRSGCTEASYTTYNIFRHFDTIDNMDIYLSPQYFSGLILLRKSEKTIGVINKWSEAINTHHYLFRDDDNNDEFNSLDFIENRHDQSALSLIIKLEPQLRLYNINAEFSNSRELLMQFKIHNRKYAKLVNSIRMIFPEFFFQFILKIYRVLKYKLFGRVFKIEDYKPY